MFTFEQLNNRYIYSERLHDDIDNIIVSAIFGKKRDILYELEIDFEPMGTIGSGDSWRWRTSEINEKQIREFINEMFFLDLSTICSLPDRERFNIEVPNNISQQCKIFDTKYHGGEVLMPSLPSGVQWRLWPGKYIDYTN